jgi:hypothetical protein
MRLRAEPLGSFHSYNIFPHATSDLLTFEGGKVTLRTCCGDETWGTYRKRTDGQWEWTWTMGRRPAGRWIVQPGAFTMTFTDTQTATSFTLRRRMFEKIPF